MANKVKTKVGTAAKTIQQATPFINTTTANGDYAYAPTGGTLVSNNGVVTPQGVNTKDKYVKNANKTANALYGAYNTQYQALRDTKNRATTLADTAYNGVARNAYNSYMQGLRNRRSVASNAGMTGGAVEQMNVQSEVNRNKNLATGQANRAMAISNAEQQFNTDSANALSNYQQNVAGVYDEARKASLDAANERANYNLSYYQDTIGRYDTIDKVNKAIKALKRNKKNVSNYRERLWMLEAQKASLQI